jgi:hypothetical protein
MSMRTLLNLPDPSPDWRGLAHVIAKSNDLRDDVTLVIETDRIRFFDAECREIQTGLAPNRWSNTAISQLSSKLSLLDWLHENFSRDSESFPLAQARKASRTAGYVTSERGERDIRSGASQSTF